MQLQKYRPFASMHPKFIIILQLEADTVKSIEMFSVPGMRITRTPKRGTKRLKHVYVIGQHSKLIPSHPGTLHIETTVWQIALEQHHWMCLY